MIIGVFIGPRLRMSHLIALIVILAGFLCFSLRTRESREKYENDWRQDPVKMVLATIIG